jgi:hypothetical protein
MTRFLALDQVASEKIKLDMNIYNNFKCFVLTTVLLSNSAAFAMKRSLPPGSVSGAGRPRPGSPPLLFGRRPFFEFAGGGVYVPKAKKRLLEASMSALTGEFAGLAPRAAGGEEGPVRALVFSGPSAFVAVEQLRPLSPPVSADAPLGGAGGGGGGGGGGPAADAAGAAGSPARNRNQVTRLDGLRAVVSYDYSQNSEFRSGDLWYGLQQAREVTVHALRRDHGVLDRVLVVDPLNQFFWVNRKTGADGSRVPMDREDISRLVEQAIAEGEWDETNRRRLEAYGQAVSDLVATSRDDEEFYRRACVFALSFHHTQGQKIHFILDRLNLDDVKNRASEHFESFTSHELRGVLALYQRDPTLLKTVIFYYAGQRLSEGEAARVLKSLEVCVNGREVLPFITADV